VGGGEEKIGWGAAGMGAAGASQILGVSGKRQSPAAERGRANQTTDGHTCREVLKVIAKIKAAKNRQTVQSWRSERTGMRGPATRPLIEVFPSNQAETEEYRRICSTFFS